MCALIYPSSLTCQQTLLKITYKLIQMFHILTAEEGKQYSSFSHSYIYLHSILNAMLTNSSWNYRRCWLQNNVSSHPLHLPSEQGNSWLTSVLQRPRSEGMTELEEKGQKEEEGAHGIRGTCLYLWPQKKRKETESSFAPLSSPLPPWHVIQSWFPRKETSSPESCLATMEADWDRDREKGWRGAVSVRCDRRPGDF